MEVARIGKAVGDEDPAHTLSDLNLSPTSTESLFVGFIDLTTDVPVKFWVKRNVSIVLEIVGFKSHWGKH